MRWFAVVFLLGSGLCHAQTAKDAPLFRELEAVKEAFLVDHDSSYALAQQLRLKSDRLKDVYVGVYCRFIMGYIASRRLDFKAAVTHYLDAIHLAETKRLKKLDQPVISMYRNLGNILQQLRAYDLSLDYTQKGIEKAREAGNEAAEVKLFKNLSGIYIAAGRYDEAIETLTSLIPSVEKDRVEHYQLLNNLAYSYLCNGDYNEAISSVYTFEKRVREHDMEASVRLYSKKCYATLAKCYTSLGKLDSADYYYKQSIELSEVLLKKQKVLVNRIITIIDYAHFKFNQSEYDEAQTLLNQADSLLRNMDPQYAKDMIQKDIENRVIELYSLLSKIAFIREDFEKSTRYKGIYEKKMAENVRLHKDNNMVQFIADYYTKIDQDREQAKIRSYSMTLLGSLLFLLAFTFSANRYQRYRTKKKLEKETIDKRMAELRALKAQINPHFLFNALNSIQEYLFSNEKNVAEGYLVKYGKLMRKTLDHSNELTVSLQEELETLRLYVDLEQLRVKHGFDFEVKIAEELDPHLVQIPSMVIQPFIENAIWHGVSKLKYKGMITLSFDLNDDLLVVRIRDNGKGFDVKTVAKGTISKGVNLVRKRLELLRTPVGDEMVLEIRSAIGKGTEVTLRFSGELV